MKRPSFTLLELVIVIILIAILSFSINISIPDNRLQIATDIFKNYINFTRSLALKDDKYIPFPKNNSSVETNKSKKWFRRFWQLKIGKTSDNKFFLQVYTDSDLNGSISVGDYAKNPLNGKYINGNYNSSTADRDANLSNFGITNITYKYNGTVNTITTHGYHIYFDNYGNVYINKNDNDNANIFKNMKLLTSNLEINFTQKHKSKVITITPTGFIY